LRLFHQALNRTFSQVQPLFAVVLLSGCIEEKTECESDSDCVNSCCGCVSIKDKSCDGVKCEFLPLRICKCVDGNCTEVEGITKEQAIEIASQTEDVKEFLKLYPDANVNIVEVDNCDMPWYVSNIQIHITATIKYGSPVWVVAYTLNKIDVNRHWSAWNDTAVKIGIDSETGEILAKYPKLEYIKNPTYCEGDVDCIAPIDEHGYSCSCTNFIQPVHVMMSCRGGKPLNCTCLNNACATVDK